MFDKLKVKIGLWIIKGLGEDTWRRRLVIGRIIKLIGGLNMKASWKTTLCGLLGAMGAFLITVKDPSWVSLIGQFMAAVGTAGVGLFARDNDKTSEDSGAK